MSLPIKRHLARGFTLIELLIVVIILAILAAIAIPQFSSSTSDAQMAALDSNLSAMRTALEQYKVQHNNVYPGTVISGGGTCPTGATAVAGDVGAAATAVQLSNFTNAAGQACTLGDPVTFKYGPYMRQGIPTEPFSNSNAIAMATATAGGAGWSYNSTTGQFTSNNSNVEATGATRKFSEH